MPELKLDIQPVAIKKPATTLRPLECRITLQYPEAESYGQISFGFFDEDNNFVESRNVNFTKAELDGWGEDDAYLFSLATVKLGLTELTP